MLSRERVQTFRTEMPMDGVVMQFESGEKYGHSQLEINISYEWLD